MESQKKLEKLIYQVEVSELNFFKMKEDENLFKENKKKLVSFLKRNPHLKKSFKKTREKILLLIYS